MQIAQDRLETLGPAERIIQALTTMTDHMVHNRPGLVSTVNGVIGAKWEPCTWSLDPATGEKVCYVLSKQGKKQIKTRAGVLGVGDDNIVREGNVVMGEYRKPNDRNKLFPEIAVYLYKQVAEVFKMDNEFAAHWASYAFAQENRDLKVILAAFMLVQNRAGDPVVSDGEVLFFDDDFRAVGEAMFLIKGKGNNSMEPKLLLRVGDVLKLEGVAQINREMGFGRSARNAALGRYDKAVTKWLRYREQNPAMLKGLVDGGMTNVVKALARRVHYKPLTDAFFETLGWNQKVNEHRKIAIGKTFEGVTNFEGLDEAAICQRIVTEKIGYKRLVGLMPKGQEMTAAIMAATIEAGSLSDKDLIILTPTLEKLGLINVEPYKTRLAVAYSKAEDQRAANVARNVQSKEAREGLEAAADVAAVKAFAEVTKGLRVYCMVDKSSSMEGALEAAQDYLARFLGGFPLDKLHVAVFNSQGTEIEIKAPKRAAVTHAFKGHGAGGGTRYVAGVAALQHHKPAADEDALFIFVGDQAGETGIQLAQYIERTGLNPVAFGYLRCVSPNPRWKEGDTVQMAAKHLGIPCFDIEVGMFAGDDPYAITRILRDMIAATPVIKAGGPRAAVQRVTLAEQILRTPLLQRPVWAEAA
jgi:hypothetical protein